MALTKKQQIRGVRILLTVCFGYLLSSIIIRYIIHGIVETVRRPTNAYAITMIVLGTLFFVSLILAIYATWFDTTIIMLVTGIVLICVFILTLVFGIIRIVKVVPHRVMTVESNTNVRLNDNETTDTDSKKDYYLLTEDLAKLIVELVVMLFAILGSFILFRYLKTKYSPVATTEPKAS